MKACNALATLHEAGLVLMLNPAGGLAVSPASRITPELRIVIKTNRDDLLAQLSQEAINDADLHPHIPDRCCWPHSDAMNGQEIDTFTARLAQFTDKGLSLDAAERLADKLVIRDRESDDQRVCLECKHVAGHGAGWRCGNALVAGFGMLSRTVQLPVDLAVQFQRCDGFAAHVTSTSHGTDDR